MTDFTISTSLYKIQSCSVLALGKSEKKWCWTKKRPKKTEMRSGSHLYLATTFSPASQ